MNFKVILALSASLSSFHAMANCLGEICVGEVVINNSGEVSKVIAIDEGKIVTRDNSSQIRSYAVSELADEVPSNKFPEGKIVLDDYGYTGKVIKVFRNGEILYRRDGNSYDSISSSLAPEVESLNKLKAGTRIIDDYNYKGEVKRLFENQTIFYRREGNSYDTRTAAGQLTLRAQSHGSLEINSLIIDEYNYRGTVTDIYEDGRTFYRRSGNSSDSMTISSKLILKANSLGQFRVGTEILDEYNYRGSVTDLYQDGRTFYKRQGNSSESMVSSPNNLTLKVPEVAGLKQGTSIIDEYNYTGTVTDTYKDGRVFYQRTGNSSESMTVAPKLVKEVASLGEIKPGTAGIDTYNQLGVVQNCFADGRMIFKRNGNTSGHVATVIYPEVEDHRRYSKEVSYASNNLKIGKPSAFYSNGLVLHQNDIVEELYESVERYENIDKESELVTLAGTVAKAKDIYANGVVVLEDEASSIRRLLNFRELKDERKESVLNSLVYHIANRLEAEKDIDTELTWIFSAEEGATIKSELIDYLRALDARWIDNKTRKKVMQKLLNIVMPGEDDMEDPEEYSLSVTPAEVIDDVKSALDQQQKKYVFVSPSTVKTARKAIIFNFSKSLLSGRCSIVIKERGREVTNINSKMGRGDVLRCVDELRK